MLHILFQEGAASGHLVRVARDMYYLLTSKHLSLHSKGRNNSKMMYGETGTVIGFLIPYVHICIKKCLACVFSISGSLAAASAVHLVSMYL
jgi:hypothetical protein